MQTTRRSADDNKVHPKDQKRGVEDAAIRNNEMRLYIPPHLVLRLEPLKRGTKIKPQKETLTERKAEEISTNAEGKCRNPKRRLKRYQGKCRSRQKQN